MASTPEDFPPSRAEPDPASMPTHPWPAAVIVGLALAGLLSPLIPLAGAIVAYVVASSHQGTILAGVGLAYVLLELTVLAAWSCPGFVDGYGLAVDILARVVCS
jgi:hypothetical protein